LVKLLFWCTLFVDDEDNFKFEPWYPILLRQEREVRDTRVLELVDRYGQLNTAEACRLINGVGKAELAHCYESQEFGGTTRAHCANQDPDVRSFEGMHCETDYGLILSSLRRLLREHKIKHAKVRMRDRGGIGSDVFNIWMTLKQVTGTLDTFLFGGKWRILLLFE
jgi:hypothetical protein